MKVAMMSMLVPQHVAGGMEIHTLELCRGLTNAGCEIHIITSRHPDGIEKEVVDGVTIHYTDVRATSKKPMGRSSCQYLERLHKVVGFDLVHSQSFAAHYLVKLGFKERMGIPLVTTMHGTAKTEVKSNINQGMHPMLFPKIGFHIFNHYFRTRHMIQQSDAVISISNELTAAIPREFRILADRVKTVYNGIDTKVFSPGQSSLSRRYAGKKVILSVCVLHRQKGVQHLINTISKLEGDTQLIVVGDGPYRRSLETLVEELGLGGRVEFAGLVKNDELPDYYNLASVFVIPTVRVEGLPLILLEAMSCAKPVIASDIGGIPTVIEDGVNGMLVPSADEKSLKAAISRVLGDDVLAQRLGKNARDSIMCDFSKSAMVGKTLDVYRGVVR